MAHASPTDETPRCGILVRTSGLGSALLACDAVLGAVNALDLERYVAFTHWDDKAGPYL